MKEPVNENMAFVAALLHKKIVQEPLAQIIWYQHIAQPEKCLSCNEKYEV